MKEPLDSTKSTVKQLFFCYSIGKLSREEEGNSQYEYSYGINDDELLLTEIWKDEAAIEAHKNADHFIKLGSLKVEFVDDTEILRYKADQI